MKPLGQLEPNLVGMFIGWLYKKFVFFVDRQYTKDTRDPKYVDHLFFNQL